MLFVAFQQVMKELAAIGCRIANDLIASPIGIFNAERRSSIVMFRQRILERSDGHEHRARIATAPVLPADGFRISGGDFFSPDASQD